MNQILITKKLYVTPELKRKNKIYKINFILSVFLVIALISFYIYAEYDRSKEDNVAQDILTSINSEEDKTTANKDVLKVVLNGPTEEVGAITQEQNEETKKTILKASNGETYTTLATVNIPKINVKYPVLLPPDDTAETTEETLKVSPCKFWGAGVNEVGNFCIVGHNYRNTKFFSKVPTLENGDIVELIDIQGTTMKYKVYDKYTVEPTDVSCTSQLTNGRKEVTLITCTDDSQMRVIVKCKEIK